MTNAAKPRGRTIRVLVVDDHPVVRHGVIGILEDEIRLEVVGEAGSGHEAVAQYAAMDPDVVLMDMRMPGLSGPEAVEVIRRLRPDAKIVMMTVLDAEENLYQCLSAGAKGYILKDAAPDEFVSALLAAASGERPLPNAAARRIVPHMLSPLSGREVEILHLVSTGMSNKQIARAANITEGTVKFHITSIMTKLGCGSRTEAVAAGVRRGIIKFG